MLSTNARDRDASGARRAAEPPPRRARSARRCSRSSSRARARAAAPCIRRRSRRARGASEACAKRDRRSRRCRHRGARRGAFSSTQRVAHVRHPLEQLVARDEVAIEALDRRARQRHGRHRDERADPRHDVVAQLLNARESLRLRPASNRSAFCVEPVGERNRRADRDRRAAIALPSARRRGARRSTTGSARPRASCAAATGATALRATRARAAATDPRARGRSSSRPARCTCATRYAGSRAMPST